jgi:serine/threonine-protein kinase
MSTNPAKPLEQGTATAAAGPDLAGDGQQLLGPRYRLLRRLADGAMGAVWQGEDRLLGRRVAIKMLHPRKNASDVDWAYLKQRLSREARIIATVHHRAIVHALDVGATSSGEPYIVLEFLRGKSLDRFLAGGRRIAPVRAVQVMLPIAEGLATIHSLGIVHRDVKPENVFVAWEPVRQLRPKLIDFGVAKLMDPFQREQLTGAGMIGTPGYMAPEQMIDSSDVDGRADMWSFCVVLYEMLCGHLPFPGRTCTNVLRSVLKQVPPPPKMIDLDPELWSAIERGLHPAREKRWETMRSLAATLRSWNDNQASSTSGVRRKPLGA